MEGYQWLIPLSYGLASFAVELAGEFQSTTFEESAMPPFSVFKSPITAEMTFDSSAILSIKPGYFITNNLLIFAELGAVYTLVSDIKTDAGNRSPVDPSYMRFGEYDDESLGGFRVGAGINFLVTKSISIEASWRYTTYSDFTKMRELTDLGQEEKFEVSDISTQQAFLGFHYYFN